MAYWLLSALVAFLLAPFSAATGGPAAEAELRPIDLQLIAELQQIGIDIDTEVCVPRMLGSYDTEHSRLVLCRSLGQGPIGSTLTHEAVHVVQHCMADGLGSAPIGEIRPSHRPMILRAADLHHGNVSMGESVYRNAPPIVRLMEMEAYALQAEPKQVLELLQRECFRRLA